jgi:porin
VGFAGRHRIVQWLALPLFAASCPAQAEPAAGTPGAAAPLPTDAGIASTALREEETGAVSGLTGDLFGLRSRLTDTGIDLSGHYVSETAWNYRGGRRREVTETGELAVGLRLDMQRIAATDGTFQAAITYRRGKQLDAKAGLGTLQEVQEIYGRGQTWRLTQFWYEQRLLGGALAIKAGRTAPSEDFSAFSCIFQNLAFCGSQPGNIVTDYWYNWPVSQWGLRVRASHGGAYAQVAVYEENPRNLDKSFIIGRFKGATGALIPIEFGLRRGADGGGHVGTYKVGGWISTANAPDILLDLDRRRAVLTGLAPLQRNSAYGVWLSAEQQVTGRSARGESVSGLSLFLNVLQTDRRTAIVDNQIVAGLFFRDLLPGLANDLVGFGAARTHVSNRFDRSETLGGRPARGAEYSFELFYGFRPLGWLELRPNLQWIHRPGGRRNTPSVGVAGIKALLRL